MAQASFEDIMLDPPVPGQSLTNDPDNPMPFETAPEFTNYDKATHYLFEVLRKQDNISDLLSLIRKGIPIDMLAQGIVFTGFFEGKWTPDLMLLLIEPVIYILLFFCEQSGVDYNLSMGEFDDYMEQEDRLSLGVLKELYEGNEKVPSRRSPVMDVDQLQGSIPKSLLAKMKGEE